MKKREERFAHSAVAHAYQIFAGFVVVVIVGVGPPSRRAAGSLTFTGPSVVERQSDQVHLYLSISRRRSHRRCSSVIPLVLYLSSLSSEPSCNPADDKGLRHETRANVISHRSRAFDASTPCHLRVTLIAFCLRVTACAKYIRAFSFSSLFLPFYSSLLPSSWCGRKFIVSSSEKGKKPVTLVFYCFYNVLIFLCRHHSAFLIIIFYNLFLS